MAKTIKVKKEDIEVSDDYYALIDAIKELTRAIKVR